MNEPTPEEKFDFFMNAKRRLLKDGEDADMMQIITDKETGKQYRYAIESHKEIQEYFAGKVLERVNQDVLKKILEMEKGDTGLT